MWEKGLYNYTAFKAKVSLWLILLTKINLQSIVLMEIKGIIRLKEAIIGAN